MDNPKNITIKWLIPLSVCNFPKCRSLTEKGQLDSKHIFDMPRGLGTGWEMISALWSSIGFSSKDGLWLRGGSKSHDENIFKRFGWGGSFCSLESFLRWMIEFRDNYLSCIDEFIELKKKTWKDNYEMGWVIIYVIITLYILQLI